MLLKVMKIAKSCEMFWAPFAYTLVFSIGTF